jgi:DNA-binding response OmpR family regulator
MSVLRKQKLLVAEDDASMRRFLEVVLRQAGYDVILAEDGLAAIEASRGLKIDAVVADAIMPHLSGFDLCRMMRADENFKTAKFIILSGLLNENNENLADAYLVKDEDLKDALINALRGLIG